MECLMLMILGSNHLGMRHDLVSYCLCFLYLYGPIFWEKSMRRLFAANMVDILSMPWAYVIRFCCSS